MTLQAEQLTALAAELTEVRFELTRKAAPSGEDRLGRVLEEIRQQRTELRSAREASRFQAKQLAVVAAECTDALTQFRAMTVSYEPHAPIPGWRRLCTRYHTNPLRQEVRA